MKDSELCQLSIDYWKRMIKWIKKQEGKSYFVKEKIFKEIFKEIEEIIGPRDCSLCQEYFHKNDCKRCPLEKIEKGCCYTESPYDKVYPIGGNISNEMFIKNAEKYMLPALEEAKQYCLEQEKKK